MNENTEQKAVDVLAVMDELKFRFRNCRELAGFEEPSDLFAKADEARAAVAELIEDVEDFLTDLANGLEPAPERLHAALARCGGAK